MKVKLVEYPKELVFTENSTICEVGMYYKITKRSNTKISNSADAAKIARDLLAERVNIHEEMWIIMMSTSGMFMCAYKVSSGSSFGTVSDVQGVITMMLLTKSRSCIIFHNHPSGSLVPSEADRNVVREMSKAMDYMNVSLHDSLMITDLHYYSFADDGMMTRT